MMDDRTMMDMQRAANSMLGELIAVLLRYFERQRHVRCRDDVA